MEWEQRRGSEKCNSCESTGGSPMMQNKNGEEGEKEKSEWVGGMCLTAGACVGVMGDPAGPRGNLQVCASPSPGARTCRCSSQLLFFPPTNTHSLTSARRRRRRHTHPHPGIELRRTSQPCRQLFIQSSKFTFSNIKLEFLPRGSLPPRTNSPSIWVRTHNLCSDWKRAPHAATATTWSSVSLKPRSL